MNAVDIIILIFLLITMISGFRKGFFMTLFDTLGVVIAFFISKKYYTIVEEYILSNTKFYDTVNNFIYEKFSQFANNLPDGNLNTAQAFKGFNNLPIDIQTISNNIFSFESITSGVDKSTNFVDKLSGFIIFIVSFIIVMLFAYLILLIVTYIIDKVFNVPGLKIINRFFGGFTGALKGVIILYLVFALASPFIAFSDGNIITKIILDSKSSEFFYENNVILSYLIYKGIL